MQIIHASWGIYRYRDVLEKLRDSLKEGDVVRKFFCIEFARDDQTNRIAAMAREILGDRLVEPVEHAPLLLAWNVIVTWGSAAMM